MLHQLPNEQEVKLKLSEHLLFKKRTIKDCLDYFMKHYQTEKGITDITLSSYKMALDNF